jgi:hypothetical protein
VTAGLSAAFAILAWIGAAAVAAALLVWPASDPDVVAHGHYDLADDDLHWAAGSDRSGRRHAHAFVIDRLHPEWPREPERCSARS